MTGQEDSGPPESGVGSRGGLSHKHHSRGCGRTPKSSDFSHVLGIFQGIVNDQDIEEPARPGYDAPFIDRMAWLLPYQERLPNSRRVILVS